MATFISTRETQFFYFDQQLDGPIWKGGKVLDFGGNVGGSMAGSTVVEKNLDRLTVVAALVFTFTTILLAIRLQ